MKGDKMLGDATTPELIEALELKGAIVIGRGLGEPHWGTLVVVLDDSTHLPVTLSATISSSPSGYSE